MDSSDVPITDNFDSVSLDPGKHHFQWYAADGTEMTGDNASGDFTISVCPKPVIIVTSPSCGKIDVNANQDAITAGLTVEVSLPVVGQGVEVGVLSGFSVGDNVSNVDPGTWTYTVGTGTDVSTFQALNPSITGQLTVTTCVTPQPLLPVVKTQCGGKIIVTFDDNFVTSDVVAPNAVVSSSPSDWMVVINNTSVLSTSAMRPSSLATTFCQSSPADLLGSCAITTMVLGPTNSEARSTGAYVALHPRLAQQLCQAMTARATRSR